MGSPSPLAGTAAESVTAGASVASVAASSWQNPPKAGKEASSDVFAVPLQSIFTFNHTADAFIQSDLQLRNNNQASVRSSLKCSVLILT